MKILFSLLKLLYRRGFSIFFCVLLLSLICTPDKLLAETPVLDIGLVLNKPVIEVTCSTGMVVRSRKGGPLLFRVGRGRELAFFSDDNKVKTLGNRLGEEFHVEPVGLGLLSVEGNEYRGTFVVKPSLKSSDLNLINFIDIESYLKGVLKAEMLASFLPEALKAQAIISRTFALKHKDTFRARGYGLKSTEQSQMYKGASGEDPRTSAAVIATRGVVLTSEGELVEASYHSCCGGSTENNESVWSGSPKPYTRSVRCDWCKESPNYEWKAELTYEEIEAALSSHGWELGGIRRLELDYSVSGRIRYVVITTDSGREVYIPGNKFRIIVDRRKLKSLKFVFKDDPVGDLLAMNPSLGAVDNDNIVVDDEKDMAIQSIISGYLSNYTSSKRKLRVTGRGFGHGVGLCQWGAQGLAKEKFSFGRILQYYYHGTELKKIF